MPAAPDGGLTVVVDPLEPEVFFGAGFFVVAGFDAAGGAAAGRLSASGTLGALRAVSRRVRYALSACS
ncbi:hypothetical protein Daura_36625 [Dactylosporangium aurantiacum]|uniref:Uncharacterized protein n=1 Tax=Dactylosporangium aurantiacum TaxID=35754 RepID=A0A9Q9ICZ5_9ACTN|nr:hypothetical protein [Dactylosporangium aurantiacum]MDG6108876.1 hypothetical protein [Dactylosporangium aurantiacum]UWZ52173.1 hypothetical protein Daura_36625 [Dactylosporangium aurantiacum]